MMEMETLENIFPKKVVLKRNNKRNIEKLTYDEKVNARYMFILLSIASPPFFTTLTNLREILNMYYRLAFKSVIQLFVCFPICS